MSFRSRALGLLAAFTLLLLVACQGASTQPPATSTAAASGAPTPTPQPASTAKAVDNGDIEERTPTPPPADSANTGDTAEPIPTSPPASTANTGDSAEPTPTPRPASAPDTGGLGGDTAGPDTQSRTGQGPAQTSVFYQQDGLTLEYYWPLDVRGNLSADETEILAYNESGAAIEFKAPKIAFTENGSPREQASGAWEKFPSRYSWDRIEYISIPPSPYQGEPLIVQPGEKAKLHWHLEPITSVDTSQSVAFNLTVVAGARTKTITQTLVRNSAQADAAPEIVTTTTPEPTQSHQETQQSTSGAAHAETSEASSSVRWMFNGTTWTPNGTPPSCAEPFVVQTPVDMSLVTSVLWPGQLRGGYTSHGGFRFDGSSGDSITVRAPIGSHLVQAARYLEGTQEQILLFFSVPCGFFYRFDHVSVLSPKIEDAMKDVPPPVAGDSRTTYIDPPLWVGEGDIVGTSVGVLPSNIFVDFGLYDVRTPNNVAPNPAWADLFAGDKEFGHYGVCFFDYLPGNDGQTLRSLPTGIEGKTSDYC